MAYGSILCIPFILSLIAPALKSDDMESSNFFFSIGFVYTTTLIFSIVNGLGQGIT